MRPYTIILAGGIVMVYDYLKSRSTTANLATLERYLQRLPAAHQRVIYPIFLIEKKPAGGLSGGTWPPHRVQDEFGGHVHNTNVPDDDLRQLVPDGEGLIGIPRNRWESREPMSTVFHEIGHAVDNELNMTPSWLQASHLAGVRPVCGGGRTVARYAVEAYARWITNPSSVCRDLPAGESQAHADNRVFAALAETPAFSLVPPTWDPSARRRHGRWSGAEPPTSAIMAR
jgi:hypothetical protein